MTPRDEVLRRIALARGEAVTLPLQRSYRCAGADRMDPVALLDLLQDRLADYGAGVTQCARHEVAGAVGRALARQMAERVLVPFGFPEQWVPPDLPIERDLPQMSPSRLDGVQAVLTTCAVAIAETGTVVLDGGAGMGRRVLSLVPDVHVIVVKASAVVRGVPEALAGLDPVRPLTWISGPSATSDIELSRVEGVHGPRRLEVVVVA